jgi:hypothetical protein
LAATMEIVPPVGRRPGVTEGLGTAESPAPLSCP